MLLTAFTCGSEKPDNTAYQASEASMSEGAREANDRIRHASEKYHREQLLQEARAQTQLLRDVRELLADISIDLRKLREDSELV